MRDHHTFALLRTFRLTAPLLAWLLLLSTAWALANDPYKTASDLRGQYADELRQLAEWCDANGLTDEARKTRHVLGPSDPYKLFVPVLPVEVGANTRPSPAGRGAGGEGFQESPLPEANGPHPNPLPKGEGTRGAKVAEWDSRLGRLRRDHAIALYEIARHAVRTGRAGLAFELALASVQADPDYEPARRLFGYQKFRDEWRTAYEVKKLRAGFEWSKKFGWLSKAYLRRYEEGQRYNDGRWISAAEDAELHADIRSGWKIETEHYIVHTNDSIEAGVALAVKLERLNRLWRQMFVRYYASEADVVAMFDGRSKPQTAPVQHDVMYFRNREDYVRSLGATTPNIDISIGVYLGRPKCAYFFAGKDSDDRTLYHEATHQLFHESRPVAADVGGKANFWIVEGIAMYMESLRQDDGFYVLGGFDDERMQAAKYRLLHDKFYVPLEQFTGYGMETFQKDPRVATLYSQAAGLTNFLVYYDGGRYRDALVSYLVAVYTGRDDANTLVKLTGANFSTLDKQYHEFIEGGK